MGTETVTSAVPDVLAPGPRIVFCGINPGRASAAAGAHFANPRNDFWRLLHAAAFTPRLLDPSEQFDLPLFGVGVTNAAHRTTRGSGDLRRGDFAGAAERLESLAHNLKPAWLGFVGKEAYRGTFGSPTQLGLQERVLDETRVFVLPSTSPANAAVPWSERLRWFSELAALSAPEPRPGVRALLLDPADRVLLLQYPGWTPNVWVGPGGGIEPGEDAEEALRRELSEEIGLEDAEIGPPLWTRSHIWSWHGRVYDSHGAIYLVRVGDIAVRPELEDARFHWWTLDELTETSELLSPRRLPELLLDLLTHGPPTEPFDVGL